VSFHAKTRAPSDVGACKFAWQLIPLTHSSLAQLFVSLVLSHSNLFSLLVFEQARNYLQTEENRYNIIGGFLSPVHDAYGKSSLIAQAHRLHMCEAAVSNSEWLSVQRWEMNQPGWTTTADTLCKYQAALNNADLTDGRCWQTIRRESLAWRSLTEWLCCEAAAAVLPRSAHIFRARVLAVCDLCCVCVPHQSPFA